MKMNTMNSLSWQNKTKRTIRLKDKEDHQDMTGKNQLTEKSIEDNTIYSIRKKERNTMKIGKRN